MLVEEFVRAIDSAIDQNEFVVYLQPQYELSTLSLIGAEALVRWDHPKYGLLSPDQFIPYLEKYALSKQLDYYMLKKVCELIHFWMKKFPILVPISVNISAVSLKDLGTIDYLVKLTQQYNIPIDLLHIELTETAICQDITLTLQWITLLKEKGFKTLLDDFGSGYSSLNRLYQFPIDVIKLDKVFIENIETNPKGKHIVTSIVELSQKLNIMILAEGIETNSQLDFLRTIACTQGQGFLFSMPLSALQFEEDILQVNSI